MNTRVCTVGIVLAVVIGVIVGIAMGVLLLALLHIIRRRLLSSHLHLCAIFVANVGYIAYAVLELFKNS